jgi:hypothetical protein
MKRRSALPLPRYVRRKWLRSGAWGYFFEPPSWARRRSCNVASEALGSDYRKAVERAEMVLLPAFDSWRTQGASDIVPSGPAPGSFDWLVAEFKESPRFAKLSRRTRRDHDYALALASSITLQDGRCFGQVPVNKITEGVVDVLYDRIRFIVERDVQGEETRRERLTTANHAMASAQRAWNVVRRSHPDRVPAVNPFQAMERDYSGRTTPAATYDQLTAFVAASDAAGLLSIGTAALIGWHWAVREEHILGQVLDGGAVRALPWSNYRPKDDPDAILLVHWKTEEVVVMPLIEDDGTALFPELTARLDAAPRLGPFIVMRDKPAGRRSVHDGDQRAPVYLPWVTSSGDLTYFRHLVREIMDAAGLPKELTFASFRHGGITESGDADLTDRQMRALSGHRTADVLDVYSKKTRTQRVTAARKRRDYRTNRARLSE